MKTKRCGRCGDPVYGPDEHPCCVLHDAGPGKPCPACVSSRVLKAQQKRGNYYRDKYAAERALAG